MLLIIYNKHHYIKKFEKEYLRNSGISYQIVNHNESLNHIDKKSVKGIILSGGKGNPYKPLNLTANYVALMTFNVPIIGFCLGHEIVAVSHGGEIEKLAQKQHKLEKIKILNQNDFIFNQIKTEEIMLQKDHSYHVSYLPDDFDVLASSHLCPFEIIKHKHKYIYGFQGHPEVSGKNGIQIMNNFFDICALI